MKITFFNDWRLGVLKDADKIVDVSAAVSHMPSMQPHDVINTVIAQWESFKAPIADLVAREAGVPIASVQLRAPLPRPINIASARSVIKQTTLY
jgi:hypothetical protein